MEQTLNIATSQDGIALFTLMRDASLLVHCRRAQILPEEFRPRVFSTKTPQSVPTFILDGQVAGTWRYEKGRVKLEPFRNLAAGERRALEAEAERLAAFHS